jgi:hypothetical protein
MSRPPLLVRRSALPVGPAFDLALRWGEWTSTWSGGCTIWLAMRYDPRATSSPTQNRTGGGPGWRRTATVRLRRQLAQRHGSRHSTVLLLPWPTAAWLLLTSRRPMPALVCGPSLLHGCTCACSTGLPRSTCVRVAAPAASRAVLGTGARSAGRAWW